MPKSFIKRVQPSRSRERDLEWPFPVADGETPPRVKVKVLGGAELEEAYLATVDHFRRRKPADSKDGEKRKPVEINSNDPAFIAREHIEIVWRAYRAPAPETEQRPFTRWSEGVPLADDADELALEAPEILNPLFAHWSEFQAEVTVRPMKQAELDAFVEELKKNSRSDILSVLPSSWHRELTRTLASQLATSTQEKGAGS